MLLDLVCCGGRLLNHLNNEVSANDNNADTYNRYKLVKKYLQGYALKFNVCTVQRQVTAASVSSHNLTLRHEAQVTYRCVLSAQGLQSVSVNVSSGETVTVTVLPDTMYTIGCVGYDEQGQELCVEGNTTITTREQR